MRHDFAESNMNKIILIIFFIYIIFYVVCFVETPEKGIGYISYASSLLRTPSLRRLFGWTTFPTSKGNTLTKFCQFPKFSLNQIAKFSSCLLKRDSFPKISFVVMTFFITANAVQWGSSKRLSIRATRVGFHLSCRFYITVHSYVLFSSHTMHINSFQLTFNSTRCLCQIILSVSTKNWQFRSVACQYWTVCVALVRQSAVPWCWRNRVYVCISRYTALGVRHLSLIHI